MTSEEKKKAFSDFFSLPIIQELANANSKLVSDVHRALYTASELSMWPDAIDSVGCEQAFMCWVIVEKLRDYGFPDELRM